MFGYIAPEKNELKVRELAVYKAFYCGLCRSISQRFGQLPRLTLSYDCAFIALLISGLSPCRGFYEARCAVKPYKQPAPIANDSECLQFAADLNVLLAWFKAEDDWRDERSASGLAVSKTLKPVMKLAAQNAPQLASAVSDGIAALSLLERDKCAELDAPADAFGRMMQQIISCAPAAGEALQVLGQFGYDIGKWLYLIDAWDDREKDGKKNAYNPFNITGATPERAEFLLNFSLNRAICAYDLLDVCSNKGILDNIIYLGCVSTTKRILGGKNDKSL